MVDPRKATKGRRMSKKTRKKSSKVTAAAKAVPAGRTARPSCLQGGCDQNPQGRRGRIRQGFQESFKQRFAQTLPQGRSKPLKSAASAVTKSAASVLVEGAPAPSFDLPRDGGGRVSSADHAGKKLVLFFYPRATRPAAPGRRSTSPASRTSSPQQIRRCWVSPRTPSRPRTPSGTSISLPFR